MLVGVVAKVVVVVVLTAVEMLFFYVGVVCCSLLMAVAHSFPYFLAGIFIHLPTIPDVV